MSVAYLARRISGELEADTDASEAALMPFREADLAFDHRRIIEEALSGLSGKDE